MTPDDFKAWRERMGYSMQAAATALGISKPSVVNYERGSRREDDRTVAIPRTVALACAALEQGLEPAGGAAGWHPIATTPKDGVYMVYQPPFAPGGRTSLDARICLSTDAGRRPATHWRALPPPPIADA